MSEIPDYYHSDPDENEKPEPKIPEMPGLRKLSEDTEPYAAEAGAELLSETKDKPQPLEPEEEDFKEEEPENEKNVQLEPAWTSEEEIPKKTQIDLFIQGESGIPQVLKSETLGGKLYKDLEVPVDEKGKEPDLEPPEEAKPDITEWATETDIQLPMEIKSEVPGATTSETRLELLLEETEQKAAEESFREEYEETDLEPSEQTKPDFASEKSRKSIEEVDQLPKLTKPEIPEETQSKSTEEKKPPGQTKLEFPDQKPKLSIEKTDLQPPKETKPEVPEEMQRKSTEEIGREPPVQAKPEFPGWKTRKSTDEKFPEPLESEYPEQESGKPIVQTSLEPSEKTISEVPKETRRGSDEEKIPGTPAETVLVQLQKIKPDVEEETQRKSTEKIPEPLEYTKPTDQKEKQRKSSEKIALALPEKFESEETLRNSAEEKSLELPEQTKLEFPKMESRKPTEEISQVSPQMTKPVQEQRKRGSTEEKNLELPDEAKSRKTRKLSVKETDKIRNNYALGSHRGSEVDLSSTHYENSQELSKLRELDFSEYSNLNFSESQMELKESFNGKKIVNLSQELDELVPKDESSPQKRMEPQFEFLKWSPEKVAEWISQLGFPQYKECFTANFISGNKLIHVNCSNLPQMGITDFEHMKVISRHTRELLGIEEPLFSRSIRLPYRDNIGLFLERKSHTGVKSDCLTFSEFVKAAGLQDALHKSPGENEALSCTQLQRRKSHVTYLKKAN
ncbi:LOW QUALITY PROTEIN: sterile alpha motif domain-containing protein 15 [Erethizon dorsatum]